MPLTDLECPHCEEPVHSDCIIEGEHTLGCGKELPEELIEEYWGF